MTHDHPNRLPTSSPWRGAALVVVSLAVNGMLPGPAFARMTAAAFAAGEARLVDAEEAANAKCAVAAASEQKLCEVSAASDATVARAALRYRRSTTPRNGFKVATAKARASHAVETERCAGSADPAACRGAASEALAGSLKRAKDQSVGGQAERDAETDARRFDFEDALATCVARAGSSEASCRRSLSWQFGP